MREALTTAGEIAGAALVAHGFWMISAPAGWMSLGALVALFSWLADK